jgi:hypothetical protein
MTALLQPNLQVMGQITAKSGRTIVLHIVQR